MSGPQLGGRLDAILEKYGDLSDESDNDFDYSAFIQRRAKGRNNTDASGLDLPGLDLDGNASENRVFTDLSEAEDETWSSGDEAGREKFIESLLESSPESETGASMSPEFSQAPQKVDPLSPSCHLQEQMVPEISKKLPMTPPEPSSLPVGSRSDTDDDHARRMLDEIYAQAGLPPRKRDENVQKTQQSAIEPSVGTFKSRRPSTKRAAEEKARQDQRVERLLDREIGHHTVGTATVKSFLADLEANSESNPSSPPPPADQVQLSSPPPMPRLRSFVKRSSSQQIANQSDEDDSDDLEILPETAAMRRPQPVRKLLALAGASAPKSSAPLLAKLQRLQRLQVQEQRSKRTEELRELGIDVDEEFKRDRESLIESERRRADEAKAQESDWESDGLSDLDKAVDSDIPLSGSASEFSDDESDIEDAEGVEDAVKRLPRVLDSDEEEEEEDKQEKEEKGTIKYDRRPSQKDQDAEMSATATHDNLLTAPFVAAPALAASQPTQYAPPLPADVRDALFGQVHSAQSGSDENSGTDRDDDEAEDGENTLRDAREDFGQNEESVDDPTKPDLTDLPEGISVSQEMVEIRRRFLAAHSQRQVLEERNRQRETLTTLRKSRFVEAEAEESDDEWAGLGGVDGDGEQYDDEAAAAELKAQLVDDSHKQSRFGDAERLWADQQRAKDDRLVKEMARNVRGGFRRRQVRGGKGFLDDDDDQDEDDFEIADRESEERWRRERERRRKSKLVEGSTAVAKLAANERTRAFVDSMSEDLSRRPSTTVTTSVTTAEAFAESFAFLKTSDDEDEHASTTFVGASLLPRPNLSMRVNSRVQAPSTRTARRGSTYAARISGGDAATAATKPVEILQSLGSRPRKVRPSLVAPPPGPPQKARRVVPTQSHAANLFKRTWT